MTKEEIMEMYPPGTVIYPVLQSGKHSRSQYTVEQGAVLHNNGCGRSPTTTWWYVGMTDAQYLVHNNRHSKIISKPAEFKVGDKVTITKGTHEWITAMDKYVGKQAILLEKVRAGAFTIDLDSKSWHWFPQHGHFVKYEEAKPAVDILKEGDEILFNTGISTLRYEVRQCYCYCVGGDNTKVFDQLGVDNIYTLATECYGYKAGPGSWPESKGGDYAALTRLVNKLHELCAEATKPKAEVKPEVKLNPNDLNTIKAKYSPGTVFIPVGYSSSKRVIVQPDWVPYRETTNNNYIYFLDATGKKAHEAFVYTGHDHQYAQIIGAEVISKPETKPEPKFNVGDMVQVCGYNKCNGSGWRVVNQDETFEYIKTWSNVLGVVDNLIYVPSKNEWYYRLGPTMNGHIAEHALTLLKISKGPCVEAQSSTQQHILNSNPYEKPIEHTKAVFLQRVNLQVRQGNPSRGVGLKSTVSQIRLGSNSCYHQERSSRS